MLHNRSIGMTNPLLIATGAVREKKCLLPTMCYPPQSSQTAGSTSLCVILQSLNEGPEYRALTLTGFPFITLSQILSSRVMKCHHHLLVHNYSAAAAADSLFCSFPLRCLLRASVSAPLWLRRQDIYAIFLWLWYFKKTASCHSYGTLDSHNLAFLNRAGQSSISHI